jgi:hypothetical protein
MTPEQFCYWLQGFIELTDGSTPPNVFQWKNVQEHLKLVFEKATPPLRSPFSPVTPIVPLFLPNEKHDYWPNSRPTILC